MNGIPFHERSSSPVVSPCLSFHLPLESAWLSHTIAESGYVLVAVLSGEVAPHGKRCLPKPALYSSETKAAIPLSSERLTGIAYYRWQLAVIQKIIVPTTFLTIDDKPPPLAPL